MVKYTFAFPSILFPRDVLDDAADYDDRFNGVNKKNPTCSINLPEALFRQCLNIVEIVWSQE